MIALLDAASVRAQDDPAAVIDEIEWLGRAIDDDRAAGRFAAWGRSTVVDENTGEPVLGKRLFAELHARAGLDARWPVGNAGVLHVYGYLLSPVPTPYGLKRERYLDGGLACAYGLDPDAFLPWTRTRTLLARVADAASALLRTPVRVDAGAAVALGRAGGDGPWALAYSRDGRLVTTFPVASDEAVLAEWDAAPGRIRWNAVADDGAQQPFSRTAPVSQHSPRPIP